MARFKKINFKQISEFALSTKGIIYGVLIITVLFIGSIIQQSCVPKKANILYAMCSSFVELHVTFPTNIRETDIELYRKAVRIYYIQVDSFGQERMETIECSFLQDPEKGVQVESILFDSVKDITDSVRKKGKGRFYEVKPEVIEQFNRSRSPLAILSDKPDLTVPEGTNIYSY